MPNYVPCRTSGNDTVHLSAAEDPSATLCGGAAARRTMTIGDMQVCVPCARRLVGAVFEQAGPDGVASVDVVINLQSGQPPAQP